MAMVVSPAGGLSKGGLHRAQSLGLIHLAESMVITSGQLNLKFKDPLIRILKLLTSQIKGSLFSGVDGLTTKWMACIATLRMMVSIYEKGSDDSKAGVVDIIRTLDHDRRSNPKDFFANMELFQAEVERFSGGSALVVPPPVIAVQAPQPHPAFQAQAPQGPHPAFQAQAQGVASPPHPAFGGQAGGPSIFRVQPPIEAIAVPATGQGGDNQGGANKRMRCREVEVEDLGQSDDSGPGPSKKARVGIPAAAAAIQASTSMTRQIGGQGGVPSAFVQGPANGSGERRVEVRHAVQIYLSDLQKDCVGHFIPSEIMHPMHNKVVLRNYKGHVITVKDDRKLIFVVYNPTTQKIFLAMPESPIEEESSEEDMDDDDEDVVAPPKSALQRDLDWELTFQTQHFLHFRPMYDTAHACKLATLQTQKKTMAKMADSCVHFSSQVQDWCPVTWIIDVRNLKDYPADGSVMDPASFYKGMNFQMKIPKKSFVKRVKTPPCQD